MDLQPRSTGAELHPGAVIAGRYRADVRVGAGGMGAVWSGEHLAVGVKVALKQLLVSAAESHEVVARFKREAVFLGKIRSDHVARVLDFVTDERYGLILVMEYIEGDPLAKILGQRTLSVEETIDLGADISAALVDLHRHHIVHRDLKPGNIIWQALASGGHRAVIVDFGVSRILSQGTEEDEEMTGITRADMALGTIEYMAPEQILNSRDVTPASDIYALGAILFRAHAGRHVFGEVYDADLAKKKIWTDPPSLQTNRSDKLARGLEAVIGRMLTRSPKKRYGLAEDVLAELNMLRDLMKAASFDMDTMTTRDNSAILEALAAAEAKQERKEVSVTTPRASIPSMPEAVSAKEPAAHSPSSVPVHSPSSVPAHSPSSPGHSPSSVPAHSPSSSPVRSSNSLAATMQSSGSGEPSRPAKKGVSPLLAVGGFLVAAVGGIFAGIQFGPQARDRMLGATTAETAAAAPATSTPAPSAAPSTTGSADASAAPTTSATAETATSATAEPAASAAAPKLTGKLPVPKASGSAPAATSTGAAPATTPSPKPTGAAPGAQPPGPAPTTTAKEPELK